MHPRWAEKEKIRKKRQHQPLETKIKDEVANRGSILRFFVLDHSHAIGSLTFNLNSQLSTSNFQLSTFNFQFSTFNFQLSIFNHPFPPPPGITSSSPFVGFVLFVFEPPFSPVLVFSPSGSSTSPGSADVTRFTSLPLRS